MGIIKIKWWIGLMVMSIWSCSQNDLLELDKDVKWTSENKK